MRVNRYLCLLFVVLVSGCSLNTEQKIVDLSGVVFSLYVLMIGVKYCAPFVASSGLFVKWANFLEGHLKRVVIPAYALAVCLFSFGVFQPGIGKVFTFVGLALAVIAYHIRKFALSSESKDRGLSVEVISLGAGINVVLLMMWYYGPDLFKPF